MHILVECAMLCLMSDKPTVHNVLAVYAGASAEAMREGLSWYLDAHHFATTLDANVTRSAGIIAALSPMNQWTNNKRKASQLYAQNGDGTGLGLFRNVAKAIRIFNGEAPLDVLGGDKVRAFYATILDPQGDVNPVIDRHAYDIAVGERTDERRRSTLGRKGRYQAFADVYRDAALSVGIGAAQMQAITWVAWRESLGIYW